jgi:curli biogenesis system outer membrane secretion channel CsgG
MQMGKYIGALAVCAAVLSACASRPHRQRSLKHPRHLPPPETHRHIRKTKIYKRKIAIGRFTNETRYGRALLTGEQTDLLGKQTSDMLSARLVESNRFIVLERPDLNVARKS